MTSLNELDCLGKVLDEKKMEEIQGGQSISGYIKKHLVPWFRESDRIGNAIEHIPWGRL